MKRIVSFLFIIGVGFTSCKKFLDVNNTNPNSATEVTPTLVLPQAIAATAALNNAYNIQFMDIGGQRSNSGSANFSASTIISYNWAPGSITGIFTNAYRNVIDYEYILNTNDNDVKYNNSTAISLIMKSFVFSKVVDQYNDVPYFEAFQGNKNLTPKYDKSEDIYKDLVIQLTNSIEMIGNSLAQNISKPGTVEDVKAIHDPMFKGEMHLWQEFANTLKMRLLIKMAGVPELKAYAMTEFGKIDLTVGFIKEDVIVNPGYVNESGKQSPIFNSLAFDNVGNRAITNRLPTIWMHSFYDGKKLKDTARGSVIYKNFPRTLVSQLGDISTSNPLSLPAGNSSWFTGTSSSANALGVAKGSTQGQVVMLAAEGLFLQAEAYVRGYLSGDAKKEFEAGVKASFAYLFKDVSGIVDPAKNVNKEFGDYKLSNPNSYVVNWELTQTPQAGDYNQDVVQRKVEAIITQKYIAMNAINSDEAFNEYRRTKYPHLVPGSLDALETFASLESLSSAPDRLPTRLLYPSTEISYNENNVPKGISAFNSKIFWDLN